jgi:hypothetical protein
MNRYTVGRLIGIAIIVVVVIVACTLSYRAVFVAGSVPSLKGAPTVVPAAIQKIIELRADENAAVGLKDHSVDAVTTLQPGEGVWVSSDPGWFSVQGTQIDSAKGYLAYVDNQYKDPIKVVYHTGWNGDNERWNIHPVVYHVTDLSGLREHVLSINLGERKPNVFGYIYTAAGKLTPDPNLK